MPIRSTRALLGAAIDGSLAEADFRKDPHFGFDVPTRVSGVPDLLLDPRRTWSAQEAYEAQANRLVSMFAENFRKYLDCVERPVKAVAIG